MQSRDSSLKAPFTAAGSAFRATPKTSQGGSVDASGRASSASMRSTSAPSSSSPASHRIRHNREGKPSFGPPQASHVACSSAGLPNFPPTRHSLTELSVPREIS